MSLRPTRAPVSVVRVVLASLLAASCASRSVPPIGTGGRPFMPEPDEVTLWARAEREEQVLREKTRALDDPGLEDYLDRIADRLMPDEVRRAGGPTPRLSVVGDPTLNAFAMPDGRTYLHSGLLARLDSEAQLAMILGRELAHVDHRDALRVARRPTHGPAALAALRAAVLAGTAVPGPTARAILAAGLDLTARAAISGYGEDLEREADREGLARVVRAGYDPREALQVFARLASEAEARGDGLETFLLGSPRGLRERIATTTALLQGSPAAVAASPATPRSPEEFDRLLRPVVRENARLEIRAGRFGLAREQLRRVLASAPEDPVARLYLGDLYRLESQRTRAADEGAALLAKARAAYERAAALDPGFADPFRQLGFLYYQAHDLDRAREAFRHYLALAPDAADGPRIREYLLELDR